VESAWNPPPVCFFLQGAAGDVNARWPAEAMSSADAIRLAGQQLGSEVLRVANGLQTRPPLTGKLEIREESLLLRARWRELDFAGAHRAEAPYVGHLSAMAQAPLAAVVIDDTIGLVTFPGEMFVDHQIDLRRRAPLRHLLVAGYSNGYYGYFPTIEAAAAGGYGANDVLAAFEAGAGEALVNRSLLLLNSALGRFRREPGR
jgi:hypothetical protein